MRPPASRYTPEVSAERLAIMPEAILLVGQTRNWCGIASGVCDHGLRAAKAAATTLRDAS
jgi:hypothetical protein